MPKSPKYAARNLRTNNHVSVDSGSESDSDTDSILELGADSLVPAPSAPPMPNANQGWLVPAENNSLEASSSNAIRQPKVEKGDDSAISFGDQVVSSFGQANNAPEIPMGIPVSMQDYETYLQSRQLTERRKNPNHARLNDFLQNGSDKDSQEEFERISHIKMSQDEIRELTQDQASQDLVQKIISESTSDQDIDNPVISSILGKQKWDKQAQALNYPVYKAEEINAAARGVNAIYDELEIMSATSKEHHGRENWSAYKPSKTINTGDFIVVRNDSTAGIKYQIWSGGNFRSLDWAALNEPGGRQNNKLSEVFSGNLADTMNRIIHVNGMFTIVNILDQELGFCVNNANNDIMKMVPGRYFINENDYKFIGKGLVQNGQLTNINTVHAANDVSLTRMARWIKIVSVAPGKVGFISNGSQTFKLEENENPYVIVDRQIEFIGYDNANKAIVKSRDNKYSSVTLQPGQFILLSSKSKDFIWSYNDQLQLPEDSQSVDIVQPFCDFNGEIYDTSEKTKTKNNLTVVNLSPLEFAVIKDDQNRVRIIEGDNYNLQSIFLRSPNKFLDIKLKNINLYQEHGVSRVKVAPGNWAAVNNMKNGGKLEFYPSLLSNDPYYFDGQSREFLQIINSTQEGETKIAVPGLGDVSIVNLRSDEIGIANISNGICFLRPRFEPYVFIPPMRYIRTEKTNKPFISEGDLHRVNLSPTQRAAISKDGIYQSLELNKPGQDNCWIFRSSNFEFYGPHNKIEKEYSLGTKTYIRVDPGEVGYYVGQQGTQILDVGSHIIDNEKGENWEGFYPTSVEPLEVKNIEVTSQEGIKLHLDVLVTFSIQDPIKTISRFGQDHSQLEKYMEDNTKAEMLRLCGGQPAIGNNKFNISGQNSGISSGSESDLTEIGSNKELEDKIEQDFKEHAEMLVAEYGIHIEHMKILNWSPDPEFMGKMKEQALQLQEQQAANAKAELERQNQLKAAEAANTQAKLDLESQKISSERQLLNKQNEIEMQRLQQTARADQERIQAVAEARKAAEIQAAKSEAQAKAQEAQAKADALSLESEAQAQSQALELKAQAKVKVAEQEKQSMLINSQAQKEQAILSAEAKVATESAKSIAEAKANQQIAQASKESAQLELEAAEIKAKQKVVNAKAESEVKTLEAQAIASLKQAENAGIPEDSRGTILALQIWSETMKVMAEQNQSKVEVVQHVTDPNQANDQISQIMGMSQAMQMMQMFMPGAGMGVGSSNVAGFGGANMQNQAGNIFGNTPNANPITNPTPTMQPQIPAADLQNFMQLMQQQQSFINQGKEK